MNDVVDTDRRTWKEVIKLAVLISIIAGLAAIAASVAGDIPQVAIVLPVIVVAFAVSWIQTGRVHRRSAPVELAVPHTVRRSGSLHHS